MAYCVLKAQQDLLNDENAEAELKKHVAAQIGAIARPRNIYVVTELPKTRSGKIVRRILKDLAEGREIGDVTTLADTMVMSTIQDKIAAGK